MESQLLIRSGIAASLAGHMVLVLGLIFAEAHPFDPVATESIAVDIVSPTEVPPPPPPQKEARLLEMPLPDKEQAKAPDKPAEAASVAPAATPQKAPLAPQQPAAQDERANPAQQQAAIQPPASVQPPPYAAPEPDVTVKYGVLLGLPAGATDDGVGATENTTADISAMNTAAFRRHLKTCSVLPASIAPGDNIRIVLRVPFTTDGKVAAPPALIEASASAKGPALMQRAIKALQDCQPYAMLPADKYKEWKVLDLSFTPQDFTGG